jgi:PAS domain-containing protein
MSRILEDDQIPDYLQSNSFFDDVPCGLITFSPDGTIYSANKTLSTWLGVSQADIIANGFKSILSKGSLLYYNLVLDPLLRLKGEVHEINLQLVSQAHSVHVLLNAVCSRNSNGQVVLINGTMQKINNRKNYEIELLYEKRRAEEEQRKFEFIFNLVPIQIWTADPKGQVLSVNQKVKEYFANMDLQDASEFSGVFTEDRAKALSEWKKSIALGTRFEREIRLFGASLTPEWFLVCGEPFRNASGEIETWFCCSININKQKLLQMANQHELKLNLSTAYKELDESAERLSAIAANQSHMARKPLANILGLADLLQSETDPVESRQLLGMLLESVKELDVMIRKINKDVNL